MPTSGRKLRKVPSASIPELLAFACLPRVSLPCIIPSFHRRCLRIIWALVPLFLSLCILWASQPELLNVSQIISKASAYPDIVDGIGEIRQHGLETIESAYKEILDTQMKMLENVEQKETYWDVLLSSRSP